MAAKEADWKPYVQGPLLWKQSFLLPECPQNSPTKHSQAFEGGNHLDYTGWWITPEDKLFLLQSSQWKVLKILHQTYHLGVHKTLSLTRQLFVGIKLRDTLQDIIRGYEICQQNNPHNTALPVPGTQRWGTYRGEDWQLHPLARRPNL
jgi:hypothetical protein